MKSRIVLLVIFFAGLWSLVLVRAFYIQLFPQPQLEKLLKTQYTTVVTLPPQRGRIVDRHGQDLATSIMVESLYADPFLITTPRKLSQKLSHVLDIPSREIYEKISNTQKRFVWLKRRLDSSAAKTIRSWNEKGLAFVEESKRAYPNLSLLSQTLGFVGVEGEGLEGLEKKYDPELRGEKQAIVSRRDARGRPLLLNGKLFQLSHDGANIETTVDKELQYELERELQTAVQAQSADSAMGLIMDPATGEILALGSYPTFDATEARKPKNEWQRNRVITDVFEPGSSFKLVTAAAALRTGRILPNTKYFCEDGVYRIGKRTIRESETYHKYKWLTLSEIMAVSSNIGTTKIAFDIGQEGMESMMYNLGFLQKTGVDFIGESSGLAPIDKKWPEHLLSNISFGHGVGVTALQVANAYSAVANGGKLMKPYLVKKVVDVEGNIIEEKKPEILRQALSPKEASTIMLMLAGVTERGGTGFTARVDGYPVAGKTGTAQKVNPNGRGYLKNAYVSSFVGFVPANQPQFTIFVVVDNPRVNYYGAQVAAPAFKKLASFALRRKGYMPIVISENGLAPKESVSKDNDSKKNNSIRNNSTKNDSPIDDSSIDNHSIIENTSIENASGEAIIPDFAGLTVREVSQKIKELSEAKNKKYEVQFVGNGSVYLQWPSSGGPWNPATKIKLFMRKPEEM